MSRILLVVLFIVGAAVGFGVARSGGNDDLSVLDPVDAPSAPATRDDPESNVDAESVEDAIAALTTYETFENRDGVIVGTVATEAGAPLAGVTVVARSQEKLPGFEEPSDLDAEAALRQSLALYGLRRSLSSSGVSDETGVFRIERIGSGRYTMHAEFEGYRFIPSGKGKPSRYTTAGDEVDLIALPAGQVEVRFAGVVPAEASLVVSGPEQRRIRWTADSEPFPIAAGEVTVSASTPEANAESVTVAVTAGEVAEVTLDLRPKLSITGRLIGSPGFRSDRQVVVRVVPDRPGLTPESIARADDAKTSWVHVGTTYRIDVPSPGRYLLAAGRNYQKADVIVPVEVADGVARADLELPPVDLTDVARVKLLDPSGEPLTGEFQFQIRVKHEGGSHGSGGEGHRQDNGEYWIFLDPDQRELMGPDSTTNVTVSSMEYGSASFELDSSLYGEHTFVQPAAVEVTLTNWETSPLQGLLTVALVPTDGNSQVYSSTGAKIDGRGVARFDTIAPGAYEVRLSVKSAERYRGAQAVLTEPIEVRAGEQAISVAIPPLYELVIEFEDTTNIRQVSLQPEENERGGIWIELDPGAKEVVASNLPGGRYRIRTMGMSGDQMTVDLRSDSRVRFEADVVNALRVTIRDAAGELAKAGFRDGDLIVAVGGQAFKSATDVRMAMVGMMARPEVSVTVKRGGAVIEQTIEPATLMNGDMGGSIQPDSQ